MASSNSVVFSGITWAVGLAVTATGEGGGGSIGRLSSSRIIVSLETKS